jgi:uncharacterized protein YyaL (SSP411 family)
MLKILPWLHLFILSSFASHILWQSNYSKALKQAQQQNKILMVLLIKNNSQSCKDIVKNIFTNQSYLKTLNQKTVAVIVNKDSEANYPIEMFYSTTFPTLFFVNPQNEIFIKDPYYGNIDIKDIKNIINEL